MDNKPRQTNPSAITTYINFTFHVYIIFISSLYDSFPLFLTGNARLHSQSDKVPHPPPHPVFQNSIHRQFMLIKYAFSRWSSGNRRRATSAREVIEVAGSNHAIGVILNLAWGPNNFSPSMIWSWRTRSNSQSGLGAELLLRAKSAFCFCCLFYFSLQYHHFYLFFYLILFCSKKCQLPFFPSFFFCFYSIIHS